MSTQKIYKGVYYHVGLAESQSLSPDLAEKLSNHHSPKVRRALAQNLKTPAQVLTKLGKDPSENVRISIIWNSSTPLQSLFAIFRNEDWNGMLIFHMKEKMKTLAKAPDEHWEEKVRLGEISYRDVRMTHRLWCQHVEEMNRDLPNLGSRGPQPPDSNFMGFMKLIAKLELKYSPPSAP